MLPSCKICHIIRHWDVASQQDSRLQLIWLRVRTLRTIEPNLVHWSKPCVKHGASPKERPINHLLHQRIALCSLTWSRTASSWWRSYQSHLLNRHVISNWKRPQGRSHSRWKTVARQDVQHIYLAVEDVLNFYQDSVSLWDKVDLFGVNFI